VPVPSEAVRNKSEGQENGPEKILTAAEHLKSRLAATYGWTDEDDGTEAQVEALDEHATA
jgi:hypothetical protein